MRCVANYIFGEEKSKYYTEVAVCHNTRMHYQFVLDNFLYDRQLVYAFPLYAWETAVFNDTIVVIVEYSL